MLGSALDKLGGDQLYGLRDQVPALNVLQQTTMDSNHDNDHNSYGNSDGF